MIPVLRAKEKDTLPLIRAVERFQRTNNQMGIDDMRRLCSFLDHLRDSKPEAIDLLVSHKGCSACLMGIMEASALKLVPRTVCQCRKDLSRGNLQEADGMTGPCFSLASCEASSFTYCTLLVRVCRRTSPR